MLEDFIEYTPFNRGKSEDVIMQPVGLANTRISTRYAQKSPRSLQESTTYAIPSSDVRRMQKRLKESTNFGQSQWLR